MIFSFQHPDFQQILKNVTDVLYFLHLNKFRKNQTDFGGKMSKCICPPHLWAEMQHKLNFYR